MNLRNYIILKAGDYTVRDVYMGLPEESSDIRDIAAMLDKVMRYLVKRYYAEGYDVIIARGQNLDSVKKSLPELRWNKSKTHGLAEFAESLPK